MNQEIFFKPPKPVSLLYSGFFLEAKAVKHGVALSLEGKSISVPRMQAQQKFTKTASAFNSGKMQWHLIKMSDASPETLLIPLVTKCSQFHENEKVLVLSWD